VSNNGFVDQTSFDGMRKQLADDFNLIYHVDLHGNVRRNTKLSGSTHNVFGIQVGVGVTVAVKRKGTKRAGIHHYRVEETWRKEEKLAWLARMRDVAGIEWAKLRPDANNSWLDTEHSGEYSQFVPVASKATKADSDSAATAVFKTYAI